MEIAITVDAMEPFVKATYNLEGDGPLLFKAYEEISTLTVCTSVKHYPKSKTVENNLGSTASQQQLLLDYAENCVKLAYNYFKQKFEVELKPLVGIFKYARFFDPTKVGELKPSSSDIDNLKVFPFLKERLEELKRELPLYNMAKADGVSPELDKLEW